MPETIFDISMLKDKPLFREISIRGMKAITAAAKQKFYKKGDLLLRQGESSSTLYIILDGQVDVFMGYGSRGELLQCALREGDMMGEVYLFMDAPVEETYVAASDFVECYEFSRDALYEMINFHPGIGINLCRHFAEKLKRQQ